MDVAPWIWLAFTAFVVAMLALDLLAFGRRGRAVPVRRAAVWSVAWTVLGLAFGGLIWWWQGRRFGEQYLAGFLLEKSLSVDNLFVFALVLSYFGVPLPHQRRVIYWGIVGAIALRGLFIVAGAALIEAFHYTIQVFGAFLVVTGIRLARRAELDVDPANNPVLKGLARHVPIAYDVAGDRFTVRRRGRRTATPMFAALVLVATFDVIFAMDSIPAIFGVTRETFIVFAANAFSLLGLAALYFVLVGMLDRFQYLNVGLAVVLVFVGVKMLLVEVYELPVYVSLSVIVLTVSLTIAASLLRPRPGFAPLRPDGPSNEPDAESASHDDARSRLVGPRR